jgi:hypothetical protein
MWNWFAFEDSIRLRRVRLHGAAGDRLRARQRFEQALAPLDSSIPELPSKALLIVRRMVTDMRPSINAGTVNTVVQRFQIALIQHARAARRPWLHADAATADAVLFTDEAEMVACLVRDWLRGAVSERWWWRSVLGEASPAPWLQRQVLARGEVLVPAAVRLMEGADSPGRTTAALDAWFARLDDVQAQEAQASVERAFALASPVVRSVSAAIDRHTADVHSPTTPAESESHLDRKDLLALQRLASTVPELRDSTLHVPQRRLFAQVLALVRSPSWARTPQLARALSVLDRVTTKAHTIDRERKKSPDGTETIIRDGAASQGDGAPPADAAPRSDVLRRHGKRRITRPAPLSERSNEEHAAIRADEPNESPTSPATPLTAAFAEPAPPDASAAIPTFETRAAPPDVAPARPATCDVHTAFGGIFYLLNAALALGLYGDFTAPRARGVALSPWDWLALIGRAWFGAAFVRDPVWPLLAALAGRRAAQGPGRDFVAPAAWTIDPSWLAPWGDVEALRVRATRSRLCVRHAAGFLVFDVARDPALRSLDQARALCAAHASLRGVALLHANSTGAALPRPGITRWLRWILAYLDARLALTLGADDADDVPSLVCHHAARIAASASDVDVELSLAGLPLAIRIAGLDRDPGWIPAAGRRLRFRFT